MSATNMKEYWDERAKKYKHTGWSDPIIYAFDQYVRLNVIEYVESEINGQREAFLDFGGGDGDFTKLFAEKYEKAFYFDISENVMHIAQERLPQNVNYITDFELESRNYNNKYDLIICITVLQHIKDDSELKNVLKKFNTLLKQDGRIIIFEDTFCKEEGEDEYTKWRTIGSFESIFTETKFYIEKAYGVFHPIEKPVASYDKYRKNFQIRCLTQIGRFADSKWILEKIQKTKIVERYFTNPEEYLFETSKEDNSRIYILKKLDI